MKLCDEYNCTMCGACIESCKKNAICFQRTETGFDIPRIDQNKCIECGACQLSCPVLNELPKYKFYPRAFLAYSLDECILRQSASGGVFRELANETINKGGVVVGAKWDKNFQVNLEVATNINEVAFFSGSKYVQSNHNNVYLKIKKFLDQGTNVLISALPCQIAGLRSFLKKEYNNLCTVDIVCHGCASGELFNSFIMKKSKELGTLEKINHTDKINGWTRMIQRTINYFDGEKSLYVDSHDDAYLDGFLSNLYFKEACYSCKFNQMPRVGDITLGDFFGIGTIKKAEHLNKMGVSQVIINTNKGWSIFCDCKERMYVEERELRECLYFNHNLWRSSIPNTRHKAFMEDYKCMDYAELEKKYFYSDVKKILGKKIRKVIKWLLGDKMTCKLMLVVYKKKGIIKQADNVIEMLKGQCDI